MVAMPPALQRCNLGIHEKAIAFEFKTKFEFRMRIHQGLFCSTGAVLRLDLSGNAGIGLSATVSTTGG